MVAVQKSTLLFLSPTSRRGAPTQDVLRQRGGRRRRVAVAVPLLRAPGRRGGSHDVWEPPGRVGLSRDQPWLLCGLLGDFRLLVLILFPVSPFRSGFSRGAGVRRGGPGRGLGRPRGPGAACAGGGRSVRQRRRERRRGGVRGPVPAQLRSQAQRRRRREQLQPRERQQEATSACPPVQRAHQLLRGQKQRLRLVGWTNSLLALSALGVSALGAAGVRGEGGLLGAVAVSAEAVERLQRLVG